MENSTFEDYLVNGNVGAALTLIEDSDPTKQDFYLLLGTYTDGWHRWNYPAITNALIEKGLPDIMSLEEIHTWTRLYLFDCRFKWLKKACVTFPQITWSINFWYSIALHGDRLLISADLCGLLPSSHKQPILHFMYLNNSFTDNEWQIRELERKGWRLGNEAMAFEHYSILPKDTNVFTSDACVQSLVKISNMVLELSGEEEDFNLGALNCLRFNEHKDSFNAFFLTFIMRKIWLGEIDRDHNILGMVSPDIFSHVILSDDFRIALNKTHTDIPIECKLDTLGRVIPSATMIGASLNLSCLDFIDVKNLSINERIQVIENLLPIGEEELELIESIMS